MTSHAAGSTSTTTSRRWWILALLSFASCMNGNVWVTWPTLSDVAGPYFGWDSGTFDYLATWGPGEFFYFYVKRFVLFLDEKSALMKKNSNFHPAGIFHRGVLRMGRPQMDHSPCFALPCCRMHPSSTCILSRRFRDGKLRFALPCACSPAVRIALRTAGSGNASSDLASVVSSPRTHVCDRNHGELKLFWTRARIFACYARKKCRQF